ncbi:UDP-N-acetylmuramate--L-alanine ligase [Halonatronum saccharophilum]|uniref:UDP-N-acetylmuramate--L-alanine ligase n=1 Tax=Halonatronum saccharophilum TaxID=150060 RepID=UPI00048216D6|nr:UDP-N-acetylmuramate--L-alanine ligase [Halonatronum saccharophilum]
MKRAHIIGIGGIAMSAIAQSLIKLGYKVTGSDLNRTSLTEELKGMGIEVSIGHSPDNIFNDIDKVIYSDAIPKDNVELVTAKRYEIDTLGRSKALAWITKGKKVISAAGTHGKTTTSAMIAHLFEEAKKEPSFIIGGILNNFNSNFKANIGDYFILEGDEYGKSFLKYSSDVGVITNIEFDHPDIYIDMEDMLLTYREYVNNLNEALITNKEVIDQLNLNPKEMDIEVITVGINDKEADFNIVDIKEEELTSHFTLYYHGKEVSSFKLNALGNYNIMHSVEAIAVGNYFGIDPLEFKEALMNWKGVKRRFEILRDDSKRIIISDYAHHPSEVEAVAEILERIKTDKKKVIIFQPHQYIRTNSLFDYYKGILDKKIDEKMILKIYKVREKVEKNKLESLGRELSEIISKDKVSYFGDYEGLREVLNEYEAKNNGIYLFLGAGDIDDFARLWAKSLS